MSLNLEDIRYAYGRKSQHLVEALRGVSLTLEPGELLLVLGPTGSGKSTLLRIAAGLLEPDSGLASLDGRPLSQSTARGVVGLVFQDPESQLFADSVVDDVAFGPRNLGASVRESHERAASALASVGLPAGEFGGRSPFTLSGGEARRAAIAGVLAMEPRYLLADEPTAGLDASGRRLVKNILLAERKRAGIMIVSHAAEEFLGDADRVIMLADASVAWSGTGAEAIASPQVFDRAALLAPDILGVQIAARSCGLRLDEYSLDPEIAARLLADARACAR